MQHTGQLLMIQPVNFGFNAETAVNNVFQVPSNIKSLQQLALQEFNNFVQVLRDAGVEVLVITDTLLPHTPDSIFPNNWLSFHEDGTLLLYPMFAENRRAERKQSVINTLQEEFQITRIINLSGYEDKQLFLEGTGSMVLDRDNKLAYACLSPRTDKVVLDDFCNKMEYNSIGFTATDQNGKAIYHTNVMLTVADDYAIVCLDSIVQAHEKNILTNSFSNTKKEIIEINFSQLHHFAGNMLQVHNREGEKLLVMSTQAYESLTDNQKARITQFNRIIHSPLTNIESNGGGSARCMMAEVFIEKNKSIMRNDNIINAS